MCTSAVSKPLAGGIILAGGCAKSITQTDPWCWTSWKSLLVSALHVPAQHSSCHLAARWAGWGSVGLSLLCACLQVTPTWNTVQRTEERPWEQWASEIVQFISSKQWDLLYFNTSLFSSHGDQNLKVNCLIFWWRQSVARWVWWRWCVYVCIGLTQYMLIRYSKREIL